MNPNPWHVDSIQEYSCLKCPECMFFTKEEFNFKDHATENHPLSFMLFGKFEKEEEIKIIADSPAHERNNSRKGASKSDHSNSVHERKKPYECSICSDTFSLKKGLKTHLASIHEGIKPFECSVCFKRFVGNSKLRKHFSSVHEGKNFECSLCDAKFSRQGNLKGHFESIHEGIKPFSCEKCDMNFAQKSNLKTHIAKYHPVGISNEDKTTFTKDSTGKYACSICDNNYPFISYLKRHMKKYHPEIILNEDKKVFTKETTEKYSCSMCDKSYPFLSYLKRHMKQTHGFSIENFQQKNDFTENQIESTISIEEKIDSSDKTNRDIKIEPVEKLVCEPSLFD